MGRTILQKIYRWLQNRKRRLDRWTKWPPLGAIDFGDLRRVTPISPIFGFNRGNPIDRYYEERFLRQYLSDIQGSVLEIGDPRYTRKFGGNRVTQSDVLHGNLSAPNITIVADLARADHIPSDSYDCLILTQTLQLIYQVRAALKTSYRILKPGGVMLAIFPGITRLYHPDFMEKSEDYWRFTSRAAQRIFTEVFPSGSVTVQAHGNVLTAISFLFGLAAEELRPEELDYHDPDYGLLITVRAVKPRSDSNIINPSNDSSYLSP